MLRDIPDPPLNTPMFAVPLSPIAAIGLVRTSWRVFLRMLHRMKRKRTGSWQERTVAQQRGTAYRKGALKELYEGR